MTVRLLDHRSRPRIVITGMGALTPIGNSVAESWDNLLAGNSGITRITQFDPEGLLCQIAGEVKDFNPRDFMAFKDARRMSRCSQFGVAAAKMALADAGLPPKMVEPERAGVCVGTALGGFEKGDEGMRVIRERGPEKLSPFQIVSTLPNMPSHHVSLAVNTQGPIGTPVAACASGTQAIGEGAEYIRRGSAEIVLAGGVEAVIHLGALAGFAAMRGLPTGYNDRPEQACRPFDLERSGFVYSEGVGMVVLETLEHALGRGAKIYAELLGHSSSSDAHHMAIPDPEARGAIRAMRWAMQDANIDPEAIDYINAHGSATPVNDALETAAIKKTFGERAYDIPVSSTKALMGHAMGGTGTIEAIFCIQMLNHGIIAPTWNLDTPDPACDLDYVPNAPRKAALNTVLSNSFGLGGQNACLILSRYNNGTSTK